MIAIPPGSETHRILESNACISMLEVDVFWEPSGLPSTFLYPFIIVTATTLYNGMVTPVSKRTIGSLKFDECCVDMYGQMIHPAFRPFYEKELFTRFTHIIESNEFRKCLLAFNGWVSGLPPTERWNAVKMGRNTGGQQIVGR